MDDELLALLRRFDTPTICNAIEIVQGRRGFQGFTRGTVLSNDPGAPPIVGRAVTARIAGQRPSEEPADVIRTRRMAYYRAMAEAPKPSVAVIEDVDHPDCVGAYWGEVNTWIHKAFGAPDFPVIAGSVGPSHGFVHVVDIGEPVTVFGLTVTTGDLVHADRHGAVAIPEDSLAGLPAAIDRLLASERIVLDTAKAGPLDFETFERCWAAFEKARI